MIMFTVVLLDKESNKLIQKVYARDNDYLSLEEKPGAANYAKLAEVSEYDIAVFGSSDMTNLISELEMLKTSLNEEQIFHINEVIKLAELCQQDDKYVLGFTPFGSFLNSIEVSAAFMQNN